MQVEQLDRASRIANDIDSRLCSIKMLLKSRFYEDSLPRTKVTLLIEIVENIPTLPNTVLKVPMEEGFLVRSALEYYFKTVSENIAELNSLGISTDKFNAKFKEMGDLYESNFK